jgi:hypothetical protein
MTLRSLPHSCLLRGLRENSGVAFEFAASGLPNELMMGPKLELLVLVVIADRLDVDPRSSCHPTYAQFRHV